MAPAGRRVVTTPLVRAFALACTACLVAGCAVGQTDCDPRSAASPQAADDCRFRNMPNPQARPSQESWRIWGRFFMAKKEGTVPVDPIPVRRLDEAMLAALDPAANHILRLGHSSHLLKLRGKYWLIDPVFSQRASPVQWAGPLRFHAPPLPLTELPPIEGLILSHDHYDHLDSATIEHLVRSVQRYFVPLGVGKRLERMGVAPDRIQEFDWWDKGRHGDIEFDGDAGLFSKLADVPFERGLQPEIIEHARAQLQGELADTAQQFVVDDERFAERSRVLAGCFETEP